MRIRVCGASVAGERDHNDDHFCLGRDVLQNAPLSKVVQFSDRNVKRFGFLAAVADGMGSYQGGALASRTVLESLSREFYLPALKGTLEERLAVCMEGTLDHLKRTLKETGCKKAGTTLAGIALKAPDQAVVFHVGDSKVARLHEGNLLALTIDHTPVGKALATGKMTEAQALKRRDAFQLTRSLGLVGDTRVEFRSMTFAPGDRFLLMTDGVCSPGRGLDGPTIEEFLDASDDPGLLLEPMLWEAAMRDGDNATLVLLQVD